MDKNMKWEEKIYIDMLYNDFALLQETLRKISQGNSKVYALECKKFLEEMQTFCE